MWAGFKNIYFLDDASGGNLWSLANLYGFQYIFIKNAHSAQTLGKMKKWVFHVILQMSGLGVKMGLFTRFFSK